ncbi:MAG TPA: hypothetical protein VI796_07485, partial [Candidatus Thermoplasmatota archaeon]|nr:hypothetical protein [Candidatus Thermoplasmatota archaeon]
MADLVRLAHDPFLPGVREAVRERGPDLANLLTSPAYDAVRRRAVERVEGALGKGIAPAQVQGERDALLELLSMPLARMLLVAL